MSYQLRLATLDDREALEALIALSARTLCAADYTLEQIEGALAGAFGVDSQLIRDRTYFVVELDSQIVACGGWSRRATLFGGDARGGRDSNLLDPQTRAAKVRAFFAHPDHTRNGLGHMLLDRCVAEARPHGFRELELMATLTGQKLYAKHGFVAGPKVDYELSPGVTIAFVPMRRRIVSSRAEPRRFG